MTNVGVGTNVGADVGLNVDADESIDEDLDVGASDDNWIITDCQSSSALQAKIGVF